MKVNWSPNPTSCAINLSGTSGKSGYYVSSVKATLNKMTSDGVTASKYGLVAGVTNTKPTNKVDSLSQGDTNGTTIYGYVELSNGTKITCSNVVKVDTSAPGCLGPYGNNKWTNKNVTVSWGCTDSGSGCDAKAKGGSKVISGSKVVIKTTNVNAYTIKDNAGNSRTCPAKTVNTYYDTKPPSCTNSGDSKTWVKGSRTIFFGCSESNQSNCSSAANGGRKKFTTTTKTANIAAYTIKDNAGNSTTCKKRTANVYVDNTSPSIAWDYKFSRHESWKLDSKNVAKLSHQDSHSGIDLNNVEHWQAWSYMKKSGCSSGWKNFNKKELLGWKGCNKTATEAWRAYRVKDRVKNISNIICSYQSHENKPKTVTGKGNTCTVHGVTFKN